MKRVPYFIVTIFFVSERKLGLWGMSPRMSNLNGVPQGATQAVVWTLLARLRRKIPLGTNDALFQALKQFLGRLSIQARIKLYSNYSPLIDTRQLCVILLALLAKPCVIPRASSHHQVSPSLDPCLSGQSFVSHWKRHRQLPARIALSQQPCERHASPNSAWTVSN